jgi:hypothetical protein
MVHKEGVAVNTLVYIFSLMNTLGSSFPTGFLA